MWLEENDKEELKCWVGIRNLEVFIYHCWRKKILFILDLSIGVGEKTVFFLHLDS